MTNQTKDPVELALEKWMSDPSVQYAFANMQDYEIARYAYRTGHDAALESLKDQQAQPVEHVPNYRGYANLGTGMYLINHSASGQPAELVISIANEDDKIGRSIGDERDNSPDALIQPEEMCVRMRFENVAGLNALESQLRYLRSVHFPSTTPVQQAHEAMPVAWSGRTIHLKTDEIPFEDVLAGRKPFELRFNDRKYAVGDDLVLQETVFTGADMKNGAPLEYTGREITKRVGCILSDSKYGLADGYVILGFAAPQPSPIDKEVVGWRGRYICPDEGPSLWVPLTKELADFHRKFHSNSWEVEDLCRCAPASNTGKEQDDE